jgi:hypothetical protein
MDREGVISSANWIGASLKKGEYQPNISRPSHDKAVATWSGKPQAPMLPDLKVERIAKVQSYLASHFEEAFIKLDITAGQQTEFYITTKFNFRTQLDPREFLPVLGQVAGMTMQKITYDYLQNNLAGNWVIEGSIHEAKPIPPGGVKPRPGAHPAPNMQKRS